MSAGIRSLGRHRRTRLPALAGARRFGRDHRGVVAVEFALMMPVLLLLLLGCIEVAQYVLLHQKLQRSATTVADLMTRNTSWEAAEVADMFEAVAHVATPFDMTERGVVIMTGLTGRPDGNVELGWQRRGAGGLAVGSEIGSQGAVIAPPDGLILAAGQTVVAAEVKFDYDPVFLPLLERAEPLYYRIYFRPRRGGLASLE